MGVWPVCSYRDLCLEGLWTCSLTLCGQRFKILLNVLCWNLGSIGGVWWHQWKPHSHLWSCLSTASWLGHLFPVSFLFLAPALGPCCPPPWVGPGHSSFRGWNMFCWALLVAENPPVMQETWFRSLGQEDPLEEGVAIHSSILVWTIPWTEEPGRL